MATYSSDAVQGIFLLLVGGPFAVLRGLRALRVKREIENIPTSKIRSAAIGRVELHGLAKQRKPLKSPLTLLDCCWWQCRIQELRSSGKSRKWVTIRTMGSIDPFFLEDSTGKVLVNPIGAEINVLNSTFNLDSKTRTKLGPLLVSWGINTTNWFGLNNEMRILEESLPDCAPVYLLGELATLGNQFLERQSRLRERLRKLKSDTTQMTDGDTNKDGTVDAHEWDALRLKQEEEFLKEELARPARSPEESVIVQAPAEGSYIISTGCQEDLTKRYSWLIPISFVGGLLASSFGVYLALAHRWSPIFIVVLVSVGVVLGGIIKLKGVRIWGL